MQRDKQIYAIHKIPDNVKQNYPDLKQFTLYQYFGQNANSSLLYSILHYCIVFKLSSQLAKFTQPKLPYRNQTSQIITKIIKDYSSSMNVFFDKIAAFDKYGLNGEVLLKEFCYNENLLNFKGQIQPDKLARLLDLEIVFIISKQRYGENKNKIFFLEYSNDIYFLPPSSGEKEVPSSRSVGQCSKCKLTTRDYFSPPCQHHICKSCLVKLAIQSTGNYKCHVPQCRQIILSRTIQQFQEELNFKKELERQQEEIQKTLPSPKYPQKITKSEQSEQKPTQELSIIWEKCQKCKAEINYKLFTVQGCGHKFCLQCVASKSEKNICMAEGCSFFFYKSQFLEYQKFLQDKSKPQMSTCFQCKLSLHIKEQFINDCGHTICKKCIESNTYVPRNCSYCYKYLNTKEYQDFKEKMLLKCDGCQVEFLQLNLFKSILCNHLICFKCVSKGMKKDKIKCIEGCPRLLIGEEFNDFFEQQQMRQIEESELELKKLEEIKKQKEIDDQKQITKKQETQSSREENKSSHTTTKSQHINNCEQVADSLRNSKLIKVHSVQTLNPEDSYSKIKKDTLNDKQQGSAKQLSVIQDEGETQTKQEKQKTENLPESKPTLNNNDSSLSDVENSQQIQEILYLNAQIQQEDEFLKEGECSMCFTQFSQYNLKQPLECKKHQIGVCCIKNFKNCPQCEKKVGNSAIRVKEKLMLQKFTMQQESLIEDEPIRSKYFDNNYFEQSSNYQQQSPITQKYNQYKENLNHLPLPSYQIDKYQPPIYERPVPRYTSGVGQLRHQSMDPRQSGRYPTTTFQQQRYQIGSQY